MSSEKLSNGAEYAMRNGPSTSGNGVQANGPVKPFQVKKLSHEEVSKLLDALEKMRQSGIPPTDQRYLAVLKILKIQTQFGTQLNVANFPQLATQGYLLQPQAQTPSQPQQAQTQQPHIQSILPQQPASSFSGQPSMSLSSTPVSSSNQSQMATATDKKTPLSNYQVFQLKAQIMAYKYISRNMPLPPKLLTALRTFTMKSHQDKPAVQNQKPIQIQTLPPSMATKPLQSTVQSSSQGLPVLPEGSIPTPDPVNMQFLSQERDKRVKARIQQRLDELSKIAQDLPFVLKYRAQIELKQLKLLDLQKRVRGQVVDRLRRFSEAESYSTEATALKRTGKKGVKETSKVAPVRTTLTKMDTEQLRVQKHAEFISAVLKHSKEFKDYHAARVKKVKKVAKDVVNHQANSLRKQQLLEEKQRRERLNALKDNNIEEYIKLLNQTKSERLALLLKETDAYLEKIGSMISLQKDYDEIATKKKQVEDRKAKLKKKKEEKEKGKTEEKAEDKSDEKDKKEEKGEESADRKPEGSETQKPQGELISNAAVQESNRKYYTAAHSIQEEVKEQPKMIVGGKLKQYQLVGVQWLVSLYNNKLNGILADEMGLGKTIQTISLISYLMEKKGDNGPYLIVVPLSTMSNWVLEFKKWSPSITVVVYKGKPQSRKQIYKEELAGGTFNVLLTSYEYVMLDKSDLSKLEWAYIIIDEGHRIKNKNSKLSNTLRQYMSRHRVLLTGTPLQNDLGELWALLNFLLPNIFNSADNFEQWFNAPFQYGAKKGKSADFIQPNEEETLLIINRLHKVLRPFILRRLKSDVENELPEKIETVLKCDLSAMQKKMYRHMVEKGVLLSDPEHAKAKGKKNTKGFNNIVMQLQKICNHPYLFRDEYDVDGSIIRASGKFDLLDRILPKLHKAGHRVLIFNQMTQLMTILEDYFQIRGYQYLRLDGATKAEERSEMVKIWNQPNSPHWLFILSTKAGGLGLNLQTADTVIIFDTDWNPMMDLQAQDRVHRIGQSKTVRVFRLICNNSVEERILERASFKLDVDAKVIQAGMFNTNASDAMRKQMLEQLLHESEENKEESELITNDSQVNALIARDDDEFALYTKMDEEREIAEEREWKAKGHRGPRPPRLLTEDELPEWLKVELPDTEEDVTVVYGRGMRQRKDVVYDDGLSLNQYAMLVETGQIGENGQPIRKRKVQHDGSSGDENDDSDDEIKEAQEVSSPQDDGPKKRGRPKKEPVKKKLKEGSPTQSSPIADKLTAVWDALEQTILPNGIPLCKPFLKLPSKRDFPEYYRKIKNAISMNQIKQRIPTYRNYLEFKQEFQRLITNAQTFNQPGSEIFQMSVQLGQYLDKELDKHFGQDKALTTASPPSAILPVSPIFDTNSMGSEDSMLDQ